MVEPGFGNSNGWRDSPGQPRVCAACGEPVVLKHGAWFRRWPDMQTWHWPCAPKFRLVRV